MEFDTQLEILKSKRYATSGEVRNAYSKLLLKFPVQSKDRRVNSALKYREFLSLMKRHRKWHKIEPHLGSKYKKWNFHQLQEEVHHYENLKSMQDDVLDINAFGTQQRNSQRRLCFKFQKGHCRFGNKCRYKHELKNTSPNTLPSNGTSNHITTSNDAKIPETVCKDFLLRGDCKGCPFSHKSLSDVRKMKRTGFCATCTKKVKESWQALCSKCHFEGLEENYYKQQLVALKGEKKHQMKTTSVVTNNSVVVGDTKNHEISQTNKTYVQRDNDPITDSESVDTSQISSGVLYPDSRYFLAVRNIIKPSLLDSGGQVSIIGQEALDQLIEAKVKVEYTPVKVNMKAYIGDPIATNTVAITTSLQILRKNGSYATIKYHAIFQKSYNGLLIGQPAVQESKFIIDCGKDTIHDKDGLQLEIVNSDGSKFIDAEENQLLKNKQAKNSDKKHATSSNNATIAKPKTRKISTNQLRREITSLSILVRKGRFWKPAQLIPEQSTIDEVTFKFDNCGNEGTFPWSEILPYDEQMVGVSCFVNDYKWKMSAKYHLLEQIRPTIKPVEKPDDKEAKAVSLNQVSLLKDKVVNKSKRFTHTSLQPKASKLNITETTHDDISPTWNEDEKKIIEEILEDTSIDDVLKDLFRNDPNVKISEINTKEVIQSKSTEVMKGIPNEEDVCIDDLKNYDLKNDDLKTLFKKETCTFKDESNEKIIKEIGKELNEGLSNEVGETHIVYQQPQNRKGFDFDKGNKNHPTILKQELLIKRNVKLKNEETKMTNLNNQTIISSSEITKKNKYQKGSYNKQLSQKNCKILYDKYQRAWQSKKHSGNGAIT